MREFTDKDWALLLRRLGSRECIAFLGAGASVGSNGQGGLPAAGALAMQLAEACDYPGPDRYDFLRVAQYYEGEFDRFDLRDFLCKQLDWRARDPKVDPTPVHRTVAALPFEYVLTTNFDTLMEEAFRRNQKDPQMRYYRCFAPPEPLPAASIEKPVVYKLHGTVENWESLLATEQDVVEFMSCVFLQRPPLPEIIRSLFKTHCFLFVGYGLRDWNVRVLIQAIRNGERGDPSGIKSYAVQRRPADPLGREWEVSVAFWDRQAQIQVASMDGAEFAKELERRAREAGIV